MTDSPSTRSLLLRGASKSVGFVLVWIVLDAAWFHGRETLAWAVTVGCILGLLDMAWLYRHAAWRKAAAPVHVFGAAAVGLAIVAAANAREVHQEPPGSTWWRIAGGVVLFAAPAFLLIQSARELWRRQVAG